MKTFQGHAFPATRLGPSREQDHCFEFPDSLKQEFGHAVHNTTTFF